MLKKSAYTPSWDKHMKDLHADDADVSEKAAVAFQEERIKETTNSQKARDWEKGRAEEWQKNKHDYSKNAQKSKDPSIKTLEKIKKAGEFDEVIPAPGFLLVEPITSKEKGSYYIPLNADDAPNTARVLEHSKESFAKKGDKILFRKFAGLDMKVKGRQCKFLVFGDVLAIIK